MADGQPFRIFHSLARSGGTILSRCLGSMERTMLLSEIHLHGNAIQNPIGQAQQWYQLFSPAELQGFASRGSIGFADCIELIAQKAEARGLQLILRDWSHLDFLGFPLIETPVGYSQTAQALASRRILRVANTRHPIDQWLSMEATDVFGGKLPFERFARAWTGFTRMALEIGYVRYEDLPRDPAATIATICARLALRFDPAFIERYQNNHRVTGDIGGFGSRGANKPLQQLGRRAAPPAVIDQFLGHREIRELAAELDYELEPVAA